MSDRANAAPIGDPGIPEEPGVYLVYCDVRLGALDWDPESGPAYVGKAEKGLARRITRAHLGDTGRSTLRRTYGALLREELALVPCRRPSRQDPKPVDYTNYVFQQPGDTTLTEWMIDHLSVLAVPTGRPAEREAELLQEFTPPLNLGSQNPYASQVKLLRQLCADDARECS